MRLETMSFPRALRRFAGAVAVLLTAAGSVAAQPVWVSHGPVSGSTITSVWVSPTNPDFLYAGHPSGGVYRSSDGGDTWTRVVTGLTNTNVQIVQAAASNPQVVYAGTTDGKLFRSVNGGNSWTGVTPAPQPFPALGDVAVDPTDPNTVYLAVSNLNMLTGTIYKSTTGGATWTQVTTGLPTGGLSKNSRYITDLDIDPNDGQRLVVGLFGTGVFISTNGGASWTARNTGFNAGCTTGSCAVTGPYQITSLDISAAVPATGGGDGLLLAGFNGQGVYKKSGSGNWTQIILGLPANGQTNGNQPLFNRDELFVLFDPTNPAVAYTSHRDFNQPGGNGFYKTTDLTTWAPARDGIGALTGNWLAIAASNPQRLYGATDGGFGLYRTSDGAGNWFNANNGGLPGNTVVDLAHHPSDGQTLYAVTTGSGVFKSTDGGLNWFAVNTGLPQTTVNFTQTLPNFLGTGVALDPSNPSKLYLSVNGGLGVYESTNGGGSWAVSRNGLEGRGDLFTVRVDPNNPTIVYVGTAGEGFRRSDLLTQDYVRRNNGLPRGGDNVNVRRIALRAGSPGLVFAATDEGLFRSTNRGDTWTEATGLPTVAILSVAIDPSNPSHVYAGSDGNGLYRSADGGLSFGFVPGSTGVTGRDLIVEPGDNALAATDKGFYYLAGGVAKPYNDGLMFDRLNAVTFDPTTPGDLYVGSTGGGVYNLTDFDQVLPVTLEAFTATAAERGVSINWLAQEYNHASWVVTRSSGTTWDWATARRVAQLSGATDGGSRHDYTVRDPNPVELSHSYTYRLESVSTSGTIQTVGFATVTLPQSWTAEAVPTAGLPTEFRLVGASPNPFNPSTTIRFDLPEPAVVTMTVVDALGRSVATLLRDEPMAAGTFDVPFDATGLPSGVYLYRLTVRGATVHTDITRRVTLVR